jgi:hypothetical protein
VPAIYIAAAIVVYFFWVGQGNPLDGAVTAINELTRGERLTHSPADSTGLVDGTPADLADEAGLSVEAYSLARMIGSEEPHTDPTTQAAIAWCTINAAARAGSSITSLLIRAKNPRNNGSYGSQKDKDPDSANFGHSDRYATTALDPYDREGGIAEQCLDGTIADLTGGCTQFDRAGEEAHPEQVAANRIASGSVLASVAGTDSGVRFWRPS